MHRLSLLIAGLAAVAAAGAASLPGPHFAPGVLVRDCTPCHSGHGESATPMLRTSSDEACLQCHEAGASDPGRRELLGMGSAARPGDIRSELSKPILHRGASCADCHSVHGVPTQVTGPGDTPSPGTQRTSTRRGFTTEAELCLACHGTRGPTGGDPHDLGLLLSPTNPSYHPVLAPGVGEVPSLVPPLGPDAMVNCGDCHRNDDPGGPRGPHASRVTGLLGADYRRESGQPESPSAYALCYGCHDRQVVLDSDPFPLHRLHVVDQGDPCDRCHDPHGATRARALIRFNEPTSLTGVRPSGSGRLEFASSGPGTGACYLTCHGEDHDPLGYGPGFDTRGRSLLGDPASALSQQPVPRRSGGPVAEPR